MSCRLFLMALVWGYSFVSLRADGPADNLADKVRPVPPPGISISATDRVALGKGAETLRGRLDRLRVDLEKRPELSRLLPDIEVLHKAVDWALRYDELFHTNQVQAAHELLALADERIDQLRAGQAPWLTATGLVVRGYVSKIDGSVQPYGLVVPASFKPGAAPMRLDFWFHGRGETLSELEFLSQRRRALGEFTPTNTIVLHPYGRYCNGHRFAGEVDAFEALDAVRRDLAIDPDRIAVRGFSLGGAACWHMATHHAGLWAAAAPGAGFSETAEFLRVFQQEALAPFWWEQKLWRLYDATEHAANLFNVPTIAYSGENDRQKQAADLMVLAAAAEGLSFPHIVGVGQGHKYDAASKGQIDAFVDGAMSVGRDPVPPKVRFVTHSLRYDTMFWVRIDGLGRHWEEARVNAEIASSNRVVVATTNVARLTLDFPVGQTRLAKAVAIEIDGQKLSGPKVASDGSWTVSLAKEDGKWKTAKWPIKNLVKRHGLQGPIDDAFCDSFLFVVPTETSSNPAFAQWSEAEMARAAREWRRQFRGDVRVKKDTDLTRADIREHHLVLWGDPRSNRLLKRIASRLPIPWDEKTIKIGDTASYPADRHALVGIYPNPLNPERYVVLNSGFTFREYDYLNNARQTPKLPDWAVIDLTHPPTSRFPGKVVDAGFFDEEWKLSGRGRW